MRCRLLRLIIPASVSQCVCLSRGRTAQKRLNGSTSCWDSWGPKRHCIELESQSPYGEAERIRCGHWQTTLAICWCCDCVVGWEAGRRMEQRERSHLLATVSVCLETSYVDQPKSGCDNHPCKSHFQLTLVVSHCVVTLNNPLTCHTNNAWWCGQQWGPRVAHCCPMLFKASSLISFAWSQNG